MDQQRHVESAESEPRGAAAEWRQEQHERDDLAARRDRSKRQPLTPREREERWPIG
jgi:hypothetical protein